MKRKLKKPLHPHLPNIATGQLGYYDLVQLRLANRTIISNLLLNPNFMRDQFDIVYIISNTIHNDQTSRFLKKQFPETIFDKYEDNPLLKILSLIRSLSQKINSLL